MGHMAEERKSMNYLVRQKEPLGLLLNVSQLLLFSENNSTLRLQLMTGLPPQTSNPPGLGRRARTTHQHGSAWYRRTPDPKKGFKKEINMHLMNVGPR